MLFGISSRLITNPALTLANQRNSVTYRAAGEETPERKAVDKVLDLLGTKKEARDYNYEVMNLFDGDCVSVEPFLASNEAKAKGTAEMKAKLNKQCIDEHVTSFQFDEEEKAIKIFAANALVQKNVQLYATLPTDSSTEVYKEKFIKSTQFFGFVAQAHVNPQAAVIYAIDKAVLNNFEKKDVTNYELLSTEVAVNAMTAATEKTMKDLKINKTPLEFFKLASDLYQSRDKEKGERFIDAVKKAISYLATEKSGRKDTDKFASKIYDKLASNLVAEADRLIPQELKSLQELKNLPK